MQLSKPQLIALAILPIGYGLVAAASNLLQFFCGLGAILGAATWLLLATLHQQKNSPRSHSRLPTPWLVLALGFVLMLFGLFLFVPAAERLAVEQYLILQSQGFQFGYLDGIDEIGFGIALIFAVFCLPISLLIGLIGTSCSKIFKKSGIGRYCLASSLMLSPMVSGTYMIFHYLLIHWSSRTGE